MKKRIIYILKLKIFLFNFTLMAQNVKPIFTTVTYEFIHVSDTNNRTNPIKTKMLLTIGQSNSKYNSIKTESDDNVANIMIKKSSVSAFSSNSSIVRAGEPMVVVKSEGMNYGYLFQFPKKHQIIRVGNLGMKNYMTITSLPTIEWKIKSETKIIGNYVCQKAIGAYAGRIYVAWFTPDLPVQYGPWKLFGLPGLILEASDSKNEVQFLFKEIQSGIDNDQINPTTLNAILVSEESFIKAEKSFNRDPEGTLAAQAQLPPGSPPINIFYLDASGRMLYGDEAKKKIKQEVKKQLNNPIELK